MRFLIHASLALALALPQAAAAQPAASGAASCTGALSGDHVLTTVEFPDGYEIHGPWRVVANEPTLQTNGESGLKMGLVLEGIIEVDPATGERAAVPLPEPIETTFEGSDVDDIVATAARVWCTAILNAQENRGRPGQTTPAERVAVR